MLSHICVQHWNCGDSPHLDGQESSSFYRRILGLLACFLLQRDRGQRRDHLRVRGYPPPAARRRLSQPHQVELRAEQVLRGRTNGYAWHAEVITVHHETRRPWYIRPGGPRGKPGPERQSRGADEQGLLRAGPPRHT